jgi:hypothetical protein
MDNNWVIERIFDGPVLYVLSAAIDSFDNLHVIFVDPYDNILYHSFNTSGTWENEILLNGTNGYFNLSMTIDKNDYMHIAYNGPSSNDNLRYCNNTNGIWDTSIADTNTCRGNYSGIAVDSTNKVHISHSRCTGRIIYYTSNSTGSWTTTALTDISGTTYSSIAVDANNAVYICYNIRKNDTYYYMLARYKNNLWSTQGIDNADLLWEGRSAIVFDSTGKIHILYTVDHELRHAVGE